MARLSRHDNAGHKAERGTALIEFTLVLPMLFTNPMSLTGQAVMRNEGSS